MGFHLGFAAYYAVIVIVVAATLIPGLAAALDGLRITVPFPRAVTNLGLVTHASTQSFSLLRHPGTYLVFSAVVAWVIYRVTGHFSPGLGGPARRTVRRAFRRRWRSS